MTATKVNTRKQILIRARIIFGLVALFGIYIIVSIVRLQNGMDPKFDINLEKQNTRVSTVYGIRGNIYADNGALLATSVPTYDIRWDSKIAALTNEIFYQKIDSLSLLFSIYFPQKNQENWKQHLIQIRNQGHRYYPILTDISFDKVKTMKQWPILRDGKFKSGFWEIEKGKRMYFMGEMAKRTIGYTRNGVNIGLEGAFDSLLKGQSAQVMEQRMPGKIWRPVKVGNNNEAENGKDIVTTLDTRFQDVTQFALNKALIQHQADHGCAIVMEVATGKIKAMANLKRGVDGNYYESMNYAVDQFMEPGSTFKIVSALALLEDEEVQPEDTVATHGGKIKFFDTPFKDDEHNRTIPEYYSLQECIEQSSNVGISQFVFNAYRNKPEEFLTHLERLGLNLKPNFDIPSSNHPVVLDPKNPLWSGVTLPSMSIGYATRISPLQMLNVYNSIANNGQLMHPYMVKEIRHNGKTIKKMEPMVIHKRVASKNTIKELQKMLRGVVERGTAQRTFKESLVPVAGKTGTARIINTNGRGYSNKHMASFVGYFPADKPVYSIIVVVNEPSAGDIYGAGVAAPVFRDIANKIYSSHLKLQPEFISQNKANMPKLNIAQHKDVIAVLESLEVPYKLDLKQEQKLVNSNTRLTHIDINTLDYDVKKVPDFRGMGARTAAAVAHKLGMNVTIQGFGKVYMQSIKPGTKIHQKLSLNLFLKP